MACGKKSEEPCTSLQVFSIDIMSSAQTVFLERHSCQPVEQVQCRIDRLKRSDNSVHQTTLSPPNSIFSMPFYKPKKTPVSNRQHKQQTEIIELKSRKTSLQVVLLMFR